MAMPLTLLHIPRYPAICPPAQICTSAANVAQGHTEQNIVMTLEFGANIAIRIAHVSAVTKMMLDCIAIMWPNIGVSGQIADLLIVLPGSGGDFRM